MVSSRGLGDVYKRQRHTCGKQNHPGDNDLPLVQEGPLTQPVQDRRHKAPFTRKRSSWFSGKNGGYPPNFTQTTNFLKLAVAAGFEPAEVLPSLAFEASTFGRSDTLPPNRVTATRPGNQISYRGLSLVALVLDLGSDLVELVLRGLASLGHLLADLTSKLVSLALVLQALVAGQVAQSFLALALELVSGCLLYTSDAADDTR